MEPSRPQKLLAQLGKDYPKIWKIVDDMVSERGKSLPKWANWCFLPMAAAAAIASSGRTGPIDSEKISDISRIGALASWRVGQSIYRFHHEALQSISRTPLKGKLPSELLFRLPEYCVYVEFATRHLDASNQIHGFFAHLEDDQNTGHHELRIALDSDSGLMPLVLHLNKPTLTEAILESYNEIAQRNLAHPSEYEVDDDSKKALVKFTEPFVSILLYLCSDGADIKSDDVKIQQPVKALPKKTKRGLRYFPPDKPTVWKVAFTIGNALEQARSRSSEDSGAGTHASPTPHIRKAHWHSFWKGPKDSPAKRYMVVYWLPPIPVGIKDLDSLLED